MTDEPDEKRLDAVLDYLYEEMPPAEMAATRAFLANAPEERARMRRIRETVKLYRQAAGPAVPPDLTRRTMALLQAAGAHEARTQPPDPAAYLPVHTPTAGISEAEFARLREEFLAERPKGWRTWFYHPAWMVAASVTFVCAILLHFSPRRHDPGPPVVFSLPAAPAARRAAPAPSAPAAQATAMTEGIAVFALPAREEGSVAPAQASRAAVPEAFDATAPGGGAVPSAAPIPMPMPVPAAAPANTLAAPPANPAPASEKAMAPLTGNISPSPRQSAPALAEAEAWLRRDASAPAAALPSPVVSPAPVEAPSGAAPADGVPPAAPAKEPVVLDMFFGAEPPRLIPRPPAVDTNKLARDLAVLAGLQIGHGELTDAWLTVGMLRKYDPETADSLTRILENREEELNAAKKAARRAAAAATPVPGKAVQADVPAALAAEAARVTPPTAAPDATETSTPAAAFAEPETPALVATPAPAMDAAVTDAKTETPVPAAMLSSSPDKYSAAAAAPLEDAEMNAAGEKEVPPPVAPSSVAPAPESSEQLPAAPSVVAPADVVPEPVAPPSAAPVPVPEAPASAAPIVPPASPEPAVPAANIPPAPTGAGTLRPSARPFSTDPYVREDL